MSLSAAGHREEERQDRYMLHVVQKTLIRKLPELRTSSIVLCNDGDFEGR